MNIEIHRYMQKKGAANQPLLPQFAFMYKSLKINDLAGSPLWSKYRVGELGFFRVGELGRTKGELGKFSKNVVKSIVYLTGRTGANQGRTDDYTVRHSRRTRRTTPLREFASRLALLI